MKQIVIATALAAGFVVGDTAESNGGMACANLPGATVAIANAQAAQVDSIATSYRVTATNGCYGPNQKLAAFNTAGTMVGFAILVGTGTTGDYCSFGTAQGGSCIIRAVDGLPVELMSFSVDDEEAGE